MGFKVGMPTLELKMGATAASKNAKRFGNGRSICVEAGVERYSKTQNFDPSRSHLNAHLGPYESGDDAWDYVREQVADIEAKRKAQGKRAIRKDATIAHALIVKPDGEWVNAQTPEDIERFFDDAAEVLGELGIIPKDSIVMRERHLDEGISGEEPCAHEHYVFMARTADGDLAGSRHLRLKEFKKLNRDFPKMMQARGWDCEELVGYDPEAAKNMSAEEQAEYKAEHITKKQEHGLSANEYATKKKNERAEKRLLATMAEQKTAEAARDKAAKELTDMEPRIASVKAREDAVNAREASVKAREASVAASERGIAVKQTAVLAAARRDAEAVARRIEDEAQERAEATEKAAAERASQMLDEAEKIEADDALTRFVRWTRSLPDRGVNKLIQQLVEKFRVDDKKVVTERERRTARLRSQIADNQRRERGNDGLGY